VVYPLSIQETAGVMHYRFQLRPSHLHHLKFILNIQLRGFRDIEVLLQGKRQPFSYSNTAERRNRLIDILYKAFEPE
jgi:hypothetical protein